MNRARGLVSVVGLVAAAASTLVGAPAARAEEPARTLTEAEVVAVAVRKNPGLRVAVLDLASAEWEIVDAEARYALILQFDSGFTRSVTPRLVPGGVSTSESYSIDTGAELRKHFVWGTDLSIRVGGSWQLSPGQKDLEASGGGSLGPAYGLLVRASVVQPLLRGAGRDVGESEIVTAKTRRTSAEQARDRAASDLLRTVLTSYWELWYADEALGIQEQSKAVSIKQRDDAAERARGGSLAPAEVLSFETRVATREEDVLNAEVERLRRAEELSQQLGAGAKGSSLGLPMEEGPPSLPPPPADAEAIALAQAPELRELQTSLELARLAARTAEDPSRPRLDVDAYVQAEGLGNDNVGGAFSQVGTLGAVSAHIGLTFETPLDAGARRAAAARARLAVEAAATRLEEAKQSVLSQVRTALTREAAARRKVALAEETARIAEKQLEAEQARFQTGTSTPLEVLQAEDEVRSSKLRVARARADLLQTGLSLQHLTGRLLAKYGSAVKAVTAARSAKPGGVGARPMVGAF